MEPQGRDDTAGSRLALDASRLQLPATSEFLAKSPLDEEERRAKCSLNFLKHMPKRRKQVEKRQANWGALESVLKQLPSTSQPAKSQPPPTDWHQMPEAKMTPELMRDLRIIENRQHLDPKRFYKASGTGRKRGELPSRVQVGTVVVGAHEFYSSRLTKKERRGRIMDQVLGDERVRDFTKKRFRRLQGERMLQKRTIDPAAKRKHRRGRR